MHISNNSHLDLVRGNMCANQHNEKRIQSFKTELLKHHQDCMALKKVPPFELSKSFAPHVKERFYVASLLNVGWFYFGLFETQYEG